MGGTGEQSAEKQFVRTADGSLEDSDGNVIFFSLERFVREICEGNHCFLCGADPSVVHFNNEHIIPDWILRKLKLHSEKITLPNDTKIRYASYKIPCCADCNSFLGTTFEEPISAAVDGGIDAVNEYVKRGGAWRVFLWLALIFLKTHLKDSLLPKDLDRRRGDAKISADYDWSLLHHIHALARAAQVRATMEKGCFGSLVVFPAKETAHIQKFDYRDVYAANTVLLRVGEIAFVAVLDDSCAATHFFSGHLQRIDGPLSPLQLREVLSHFTLLNYKLKYRPQYMTRLDPRDGSVSIVAKLPDQMELDEYSSEELGEILYANVAEYVQRLRTPDTNFTEENVRRGMYGFLFDEDGRFKTDSMDLIDEED